MSYNKTFDSAWIEKKGYKAASNLVMTDELAQQIAALRQLNDAGMVAAKDQDFVTSLCGQHAKKGGLSEKQVVWVGKMLNAAMGIEEKTTNAPPTIKNPTGNGPTVPTRTLINMFKAAGQKLKKPRLVIKLPSGRRLKVYPGKAFDSISVVLQNPYQKVGWIMTKDNILRFNKPTYGQAPVPTELVEEIVEALCFLDHDPVGYLAENGKSMASCCYCLKPLSDPKSLDKGYGPICAQNWGLPWG